MEAGRALSFEMIKVRKCGGTQASQGPQSPGWLKTATGPPGFLLPGLPENSHRPTWVLKDLEGGRQP